LKTGQEPAVSANLPQELAQTPQPGGPAGRTWRDRFHRFSVRCSDLLGAPGSFLLAVLVVGVWLVSGPIFRYSDSWQLVINTAMTIVTFLMVFLIQNTQNRDAKALHLKLDELIRANRRARNELIDLESMTEPLGLARPRA
jgi:low affinity Fe/Cu permease